MAGSTPHLNIICAIKAVPPMQALNDAPEGTRIQIVEKLENQHGIWNKDTIKWWIKGEPDELFTLREQFMIRVFNIAFTEWDIEIPLVLIRATSEADADVIIEFGTRENDPYYSGDDGKWVLAYAGYPSGPLKGYMKIFTHWLWDVQGAYNILTVIIHELGHILGLSHSERRVWEDIMDPIINAAVRELSDHDIARAVAAYGAREYSHHHRHDMLEKANRRQKIRLQLETLNPISAAI